MKQAGLLKAVFALSFLAAFPVSVGGCTPTVRVAPPDEPIEINLNVRIEKDVRLRIDKDLEEAFRKNPELFGVVEDVKREEMR